MLIVISFFFTCVLILIGVLFLFSPGKTEPFLDSNGKPLAGSISEKTFIDVNCTKQGLFIKGKNIANPVLLYLHGGMPDYFLTAKYPTGLEEYFTIAWWEQRGSGISYDPNIPKESMTLKQLIADTKEVTNYLRKRFGKSKIYLMGHSGGTFIGIQAAEEAPELYYAYIGVAQMSNQLLSEKLAYDYMLEQFKKDSNKKMVKYLKKVPVTLSEGIPDGYLKIRDKAMHSLGIGTTHDMKSVITGIFIPSLLFKEYTLREKYNLWTGKSESGVSIMWDTMIATDLSQNHTEFKIPVYFFHGVYDYTCSFTLSKQYFEKIIAPVKGFYAFNNSAHSPIFEEPKKTIQIIKQDVLEGKNNLADIK